MRGTVIGELDPVCAAGRLTARAGLFRDLKTVSGGGG